MAGSSPAHDMSPPCRVPLGSDTAACRPRDLVPCHPRAGVASVEVVEHLRAQVRSTTRTAAAPAYRIRRAAPGDQQAITALYAALSPRSQRMRFSRELHGAMRAGAAARVAPGDVQLVAVRGGRVVGEGRLCRARDGSHEFALTVADDEQRHGIGTCLLRKLQRIARQRGLGPMRGEVRFDNLPILRMLHHVGARLVEVLDGDLLFEVDARPGSGASEARTLPERPVEVPRATACRATLALRSGGFTVDPCLGNYSTEPLRHGP